LSDPLPHLTLGTAGHIDHGKTALVEALTGKNTDRLAEEHRRGISIELGFAELDLGDSTMSVVDVPGHERLVRTMVAGASGIDLFMLVVAADDGPMPQTHEHLTVLRALGVDRGVIALTKCDLVDAARRAEATDLAMELLPGAPVVAVSAASGEGLDDLRRELSALAGGLDAQRSPPGSRSAPAVMHIDRVFSLRGIGTVVTGTLRQGALKVGDHVALEPSGRRARVRSLQSHDRPLDTVAAGRRVAVNLAGIGRGEVERGDVLAAGESGIRPSYRLDVELEPTLAQRGLAGRRVQIHHGTRDAPARVVPIADRWVQLRLERPLMALARDPVVVREIAPANTLGGAVVLDPSPPRHGASDAQRLREIVTGKPVEPSEAPPAPTPAPQAAPPGKLAHEILARLEADGLRPRSLSTLADELQHSPAEINAALEELTAAELALRAGRDLAFAGEAVAQAEAAIVELASATGGFTLADARDRLNIGRRHTQALLELLDVRRVTLRRGDERVLRQTRDNP
jgi:selenocysteine-specific elongation factor